MREKRNAYWLLVVKPDGKRLLENLKRRWTNNMKKALREVGWGETDWFDLPQGRAWMRALVNTAMNLRVP
jgi:hypothetical protein